MEIQPDVEPGITRPIDVDRWRQSRQWFWGLRDQYGGWHEVPTELLPAFYAHPSEFNRTEGPIEGLEQRSYATSLPEALGIQEVHRRTCSTMSEPVWYVIPRVISGELLGSLHSERKRCGNDGCRCQSGREEDLHGPYWYRHWREGGRQQKEYVASEDLPDVMEAVEARRSRLNLMRALRKEYISGARSSGRGAQAALEEGEFDSWARGHVEGWTREHKDEIEQTLRFGEEV
jgi:hypothetical protein